jgi:hypothetical protein
MGTPGPVGPVGPQGPPGPAALPNGYNVMKTFSPGFALNQSFQTVASINLPAGRFIVSAYEIVDNNDFSLNATPWCQIIGVPVARIRADLQPNTSMTLSHTTGVIMNAAGTVNVQCQQANRTSTPNNNVTIAQVGITALQVNLEMQ